MTDKKEISILLLGIVAILAIVGLVLLFTSPAATGKLFQTPPLPPQVQSPMPVGEGPVAEVGVIGNAIIVSALEGANLPRCPNGDLRTREMGNVPYEAIAGHYCLWFYCPYQENSPDPAYRAMLACMPMPR